VFVVGWRESKLKNNTLKQAPGGGGQQLELGEQTREEEKEIIIIAVNIGRRSFGAAKALGQRRKFCCWHTQSVPNKRPSLCTLHCALCKAKSLLQASQSHCRTQSAGLSICLKLPQRQTLARWGPLCSSWRRIITSISFARWPAHFSARPLAALVANANANGIGIGG